MIERYANKELEEIWSSDIYKYRTWFDVEKEVIRTLVKSNICPETVLKELESIEIDQSLLDEILIKERELKHDVLAFVNVMCNKISSLASCYFHRGLTSSDIVDTSLAIHIRRSLIIINKHLTYLMSSIKKFASSYGHIKVVARTHGQHAEIISLSQRIDVWHKELLRVISNRLPLINTEVCVGKLSGPVGSRWGDMSRLMEIDALDKLCLQPEMCANQVVQRDRHAFMCTTLAVLAGSLEKIATEIRHLGFTEVSEIREGFAKGQSGSSSMPHKMNPIDSEKICGLARIVRSNALVSMENQNLWGERDISHSSAERYMFPIIFESLCHMIETLDKVISNLVVDETAINKNIIMSKVDLGSGKRLYDLQCKMVPRNVAYDAVKNGLDVVTNIYGEQVDVGR